MTEVRIQCKECGKILKDWGEEVCKKCKEEVNKSNNIKE